MNSCHPSFADASTTATTTTTSTEPATATTQATSTKGLLLCGEMFAIPDDNCQVDNSIDIYLSNCQRTASIIVYHSPISYKILNTRREN